MNKTRLEYFIEVYERKSYKKAAEYLMISQQGVSKMIKSLEDELQKKLFIRQNNTLFYTRDAAELYQHAKRIINEFHLIEDQLMNRQKKITIYTIDSVMEYYFCDFFSYFQKKYPNISLKIMEATNDDVVSHLAKAECDFGIIQEKCLYPEITNHFLLECQFVYVINKKHPIAQKGSFSVEDLNGERFAGRGFEYLRYDQAFKEWRKQNIYPITILETNNSKTLMNAAKQNLAIVSINEAVAEKYKDDRVIIIENHDSEINDFIYLSHKDNLSLEARLFRDEMLNWYKSTK